MERAYQLADYGWVRFDWEKDVQSVQPLYNNTIVILRNGVRYVLQGRGYGV